MGSRLWFGGEGDKNPSSRYSAGTGERLRISAGCPAFVLERFDETTAARGEEERVYPLPSIDLGLDFVEHFAWREFEFIWIWLFFCPPSAGQGDPVATRPGAMWSSARCWILVEMVRFLHSGGVVMGDKVYEIKERLYVRN